MSILIMMLIFSGVPFILIQCMPGRKTFGLLTLIYLGVMEYGYYDIHKPIVNDLGDGPGAVLGMAFFYLICYGAIAGIVSKALTLYMAKKGFSLRKRSIARAICLLLIPCFVYAPQLLNKWKLRPASSDCNYDIITFSISAQKFLIPGLSIVSANRGDGKPSKNTLKDFFAFVGAPSFRKFCDEFNNGHTPAEVNAIDLNLGNIARARNDKRFAALCTKAAWPETICNYTGHSVPDGYPSSIGIYDKTKFNAGFIGGGWDHQRIQEARTKATQSSDVSGFSYDGHNYFWVDDASNDTPTFALSCYKAQKMLYCRSDEKWDGNVYISWGGRVSLENPIADARQMRQTTVQFLKALSVD